jgi:phosphoribosylaminoimidazolecarboxamide formyltransferase/IMP cyclohydrolase
MILKYGMNPNQDYAEIIDKAGALKILNGNPSVINVLDALNSWQLVKESSENLKTEVAASFKHVTPSGVATSAQLKETEKSANFVKSSTSNLASAYIRARAVDRLASFGDFIALSHKVDVETSRIIKSEVSDGIIAPEYSIEALNYLKLKKKGNFVVFQIDKNFQPDEIESRDVFGITIRQKRNSLRIGEEHTSNVITKTNNLTPSLISDIKLGMITLKYTQSNSICVVNKGQVIGIGSGQQSRILCSNLALTKANTWYQKQQIDYSSINTQDLKRTELDQLVEKRRNDVFGNQILLKELSGTCLISDGFFPQSDNIELANDYGVQVIASPIGSIRDKEIIETADRCGITFINTGVRLFHH